MISSRNSRIPARLLAGAVMAVSVLGLASSPAVAGSASTDARARFVGSWKPVSAELVDANGEVVGRPYGEHPAGKLTYTPTGHMWALIGLRDVPRGDPAGTQFYTGTFSVNARRRTVTHHVQYSTVAAWEGTDLVRRFSFRGRRTLILSVAAGDSRVVLTWRRMDRAAR